MKLPSLNTKKPGTYRLLTDFICLVAVYSLFILIFFDTHTQKNDTFVIPAIDQVVDKPDTPVRYGVPVIL